MRWAAVSTIWASSVAAAIVYLLRPNPDPVTIWIVVAVMMMAAVSSTRTITVNARRTEQPLRPSYADPYDGVVVQGHPVEAGVGADQGDPYRQTRDDHR